MSRLSISLRLVLWYSGISLLGFAAFGIGMRIILSESMIACKDRTLQMRANRVEATLLSFEQTIKASLRSVSAR